MDALSKNDLHVHRLLHDDHVGHRQRKQIQQQQSSDRDPKWNRLEE
jgi:hypothetical protein